MIVPEVVTVMDIREQIIHKVMEALEGRVDTGVTDTVQDILVIELNNYEVQERCTEIATVDNSAENMMKKLEYILRLSLVLVISLTFIISPEMAYAATNDAETLGDLRKIYESVLAEKRANDNKSEKTKNEIKEIKPNMIKYGHIVSGDEIIDEVLVTFFKSPKSFTTENMCEINSHGGSLVMDRILKLCLKNGAELAEARRIY